jgi:hypothetical protein
MEDVQRSLLTTTHPHPCPLPSRERGLNNCPSLEGRGLRGGCLNVVLFMNVLVNWKIQNTKLKFLRFTIFIVEDKHV